MATGTDGTSTITCPDGTKTTLSNGAKGASCSVVDNGNGTKTIACTDGTSVTVNNGTDGTDGTTGPTGPAGDAGTSCTVTSNTNGTHTISCTDGTSATVLDGDAGAAGSSCTVTSNPNGSKTITCTDGTSVTVTPPLGSRLDPRDNLPGLTFHITGVTGASNTDGTFASGDRLKVTFTLTNRAGSAMMLEDLSGAEIWVAGPTTNYQHILPAARNVKTLTDVAALSVRNANGSFTYTFATALPANYGVPLWDTTRFTDGELTGPLQAGTYTVAMRMSKKYSVGAGSATDQAEDGWDFLFNHATTVATREVVATGNCNQCHDRLEAHGTRTRNTRFCITCHTAGAEDSNSFVGVSADGGTDPTAATIEFKVMIHKIHNGLHLPSVQGITATGTGALDYAGAPKPYIVNGADFSGVVFPASPNISVAMPKNAGYSALLLPDGGNAKTKDDNVRKGVTNCNICHGDPDGTGPLTAPAQGGQATSAPSRRACGSCHDDIVWTNPYTHNGTSMPAQTDDATCSLCHGATTGPLPTVAAHLHPIENPAVNPNNTFRVTSFVNASDGGVAVAQGDRMSLAFTLKNDANVDVGVNTLDSMTMMVVGPTSNRQVPFVYGYSAGASLTTAGPYSTGGSAPHTVAPYDFLGRLHTGTIPATTSPKGLMSRVTPTATSITETLTVGFTSTTAFTVTGSTSGSLGTGALTAATSTNPSGSAISNIILSPTVVAGSYTVTFSTATAFAVAGPGGAGSGTLPNSINASNKYTAADGTLAFVIAAGGTAFANGNVIYFTVFKGSAGNPVAFAVTAGRTAFTANDRLYYDYAAPSATYNLTIPMDIPLEFVGTGSGAAGQVLTAANLPVWVGRQTLFENTALVGTATSSLVARPAGSLFFDVLTIDAALAANDYVVIDKGLATEEYLNVGKVDGPAKLVWFKTMPRFAHAAGATLQEATMAFRQEGTDYTLNPATGTITLVAASTNPFILNYRTDARFGWNRKAGDLVTTYSWPMLNSATYDESWGDWNGKPLIAGTYTLGFYGSQKLDFAANGEVQTYNGTTFSAQQDFIYGTGTVTPYALVSSPRADCNECHQNLLWHGSRRGADTCLLCHAVAGIELAQYTNTLIPGAPETTPNFRTFIHQLHAETFPARQNGMINCTKCHGTSTAWTTPTDRNHPTAQGKPVRSYQAACIGCHSDVPFRAHMNAMTSPSGDESCETCHGAGGDFDIAIVHKLR